MKKFLIIVIALVCIISIFGVLGSYGVISLSMFETAGKEEEKKELTSEELEDDFYYICHNDKPINTTEDFNKNLKSTIFRKCPEGDKEWGKYMDESDRVLWFDSKNDMDIPICYPGDKLVYVSKENLPIKGIKWERFGDYGYSIGVSGFQKDESGHYYISSDDSSISAHLDSNSDAVQLEEFEDVVTEIFIDKIGNVKMCEEFIPNGKTIAGLNKNTKYICEWYTGTYFQDFEMTASSHPFCHLEAFETYEYEFLHNNCISITLPEWLKTGCYYVDEIGLFRYVSSEDVNRYNGKAYDANINWNDPIITYNKDGSVKYDPTVPETDKPDEDDYDEDDEYYDDFDEDEDYGGEYEESSEEIPEDGDIGMDAYEIN